MSKKIFITGGAGYVGSSLVPFFLDKGYYVTVFDKLYFSDNFLPKNNNLKVIEGDIRDTEKIRENCIGHDYFIHMACISNDASFILDEKLSTSINFDCFEPMVIAAKESKIKRFIYASTSSVYGISQKKNVIESDPLVPITLYNKYKGDCEPILLKYIDDDFEGVIFRPATVCGFSKRMRFDLSVNILTNHAFNKKKITVFGGSQLRPNLNIKDYLRVVDLFINAPKEKINRQIFNVGYENKSIMDLAKLVKKTISDNYENFNNLEIITSPSDDNRSYHINSDKIFNILEFKPIHTIEEAILSITEKFKKNYFQNSFDNDIYYNVKRLQNLNAK